MKICPTCNTQLEDSAVFCNVCGTQFAAPAQPGYNPQGGYAQPQYVVDPTDHTAEFDAKDISDNKVISMLVYLMGTFGIIIALLASNSSPYAAFHVRQALKISVVSILGAICAGLLAWTFIVPLAYLIFTVVIFVVKIICFFDVCKGKAKEPAVIKNFTFLK